MKTKNTTISALQLRAARAALRLSLREIANLAGVGINSVNAFEVEGSRRTQHGTKVALQVALERLGVRFLDDHGLAFSPNAVAFAAAQRGGEAAISSDLEGEQ